MRYKPGPGTAPAVSAVAHRTRIADNADKHEGWPTIQNTQPSWRKSPTFHFAAPTVRAPGDDEGPWRGPPGPLTHVRKRPRPIALRYIRKADTTARAGPAPNVRTQRDRPHCRPRNLPMNNPWDGTTTSSRT